MCTSKISLKKFLKLILWIYFYKIIIFAIFLIMGKVGLSAQGVFNVLSPITSIDKGFTSCFLIFYLTIPFLNILTHNMTKRQHQSLLLLCLCIYSVFCKIPHFQSEWNYVSWFIVNYFIAAYLRLYPETFENFEDKWGWLSLAFISLAIIIIIGSIFAAEHLNRHFAFFTMYFLNDSNAPLAIIIAICTFMWFKGLKIKNNKFINTVAASAFGVLLIHANSDAMRSWLWGDVVDCIGRYNMPFSALYAIGSVLTIYITCTVIDSLRLHAIEKPLFTWMEKKKIC